MTISFNNFRKHKNDTKALIEALRFCEVNHATELTFEKDTYIFNDELAPDIPICVSNHGEIGYRKAAFLLRGLNGFTIDGGGSRFIFKGIMNAFSVIGCNDITLKNFSIEFPDYPYPNGFVESIGDGFFDLRFDSDNVFVNNGTLYVRSGDFSDAVHCDVRFDSTTHEVIHGTGDNSLGININRLNCTQLENGCFRFFAPPVMPEKTDVFGMLTGIRRASGILLDASTDTLISNVTIHSCIGVGIMAQCCHSITIDGCSVTAGEGRYVSSAADATHFVACTGTVTVRNSLFEHMLDDALNVHSIYTKVRSSDNDSTYVEFMNSASVGIDLYKKSDRVTCLDPNTLKPKSFLVIKEAEIINRRIARLEFEDGCAETDCIIEDLTRYPELVFENNTVRNNRARGMLVATNKKAVVRGCNFHTSGSAIVLECDGKFWYESGAVNDLTIEGNVFDGCRYANWDRGVISIPKGKDIEQDFFYHGRIAIISNVFKSNCDIDVYADNVSELIYKDNIGSSPVLRLSHIGKAELQENAEIIN